MNSRPFKETFVHLTGTDIDIQKYSCLVEKLEFFLLTFKILERSRLIILYQKNKNKYEAFHDPMSS